MIRLISRFFRGGEKQATQVREVLPELPASERQYVDGLKQNRTVRQWAQRAMEPQEALKHIRLAFFRYEQKRENEGNPEWLLWDDRLLERAVKELFCQKDENFGVLIPEGFAF